MPFRRALPLVLAFAGLPALAAAQPLGPTPYLSDADSPFRGLPFSSFFLETFEDGELNTLGVSASGGFVLAPSGLTDSVDGDDGSFDGSGNLGSSWYSGNSLSALTFSFDAAALGAAPTHVGIVWTDVGNVFSGSTGIGDVTFEAFDLSGTSLGLISSQALGDGNATGATAEDRFFGFVHLGGISRFTISTTNSVDWEADHLQYGIIPTPGVVGLAAAMGVLSASRRRR
jgi:hypothetical protein